MRLVQESKEVDHPNPHSLQGSPKVLVPKVFINGTHSGMTQASFYSYSSHLGSIQVQWAVQTRQWQSAIRHDETTSAGAFAESICLSNCRVRAA